MKYSFLIAFVASVGGFLFGYDLVIISGAQLFIEQYFELDASGLGFATASALLGCMFGPLLGMWMIEKWSRKHTLLVAALLFGCSALGTALPHDIITFNVFRIIGGLGVGLASVASPVYITEIAPARIRGGLVLMYQMAVVIGATISVLISYWLAISLGPTSWRWMFASELVPIICFAMLLFLIPHSPRWLASMGRSDEALDVLRRIDGQEKADREMKAIESSLLEEVGGWRELMQPGIRRALYIGVLLAIFNQWTGWSGIAFYLPKIFQIGGWKHEADAILQTSVMQGSGIVLTGISIWLVDRVGRRPLWNFTAAAMAFAMTLGGFVFYFHLTGLPVMLVVLLCAIPHMLGLGPLPWLMMSEIQPTRIRAKAVAVSTTILWVTVFTGAYLFPLMASYSTYILGSIAGVFWFYAIVCLAALFFGIVMLPETKGKTLEEIADFWLQVKKHS